MLHTVKGKTHAFRKYEVIADHEGGYNEDLPDTSDAEEYTDQQSKKFN